MTRIVCPSPEQPSGITGRSHPTPTISPHQSHPDASCAVFFRSTSSPALAPTPSCSYGSHTAPPSAVLAEAPASTGGDTASRTGWATGAVADLWTQASPVSPPPPRPAGVASAPPPAPAPTPTLPPAACCIRQKLKDLQAHLGSPPLRAHLAPSCSPHPLALRRHGMRPRSPR